ncbi:uncharacterized protein LOC110372442 [Helicoverpa armigera]|uniref:uncharacterized protein LOC110372442 n=1 Tax=Helicoverpa armigera TaxID=29058 RepID=UPI0030831ACB
MRSVVLFNMFKLFVFLAFTVATCYGAQGQGVLCGPLPRRLTRCLNMAPAISGEIQDKCHESRTATECERLTCIFREYNLLDGTTVNKDRTNAFLDNYVKQYPVWTTAVQHAKAACLGDVALKPQGIDLNCPIYDTLQCIFSSLIKHATPSQWSTTSECQGYRAFAAACPICPEDCFAAQVPIGSCNACLTLPRSA